MTDLAIPKYAGPLPDEIVWAPRGRFRIKPTILIDGIEAGSAEVVVLVDEVSALACEVARLQRALRGELVAIDRDHSPLLGATGYITQFRWDDRFGIVAAVQWTARGEALLRSGDPWRFSPTYRCASDHRIAEIGADSAGGLVLEPAFGTCTPVIIEAHNLGHEDTSLISVSTPPPSGPSQLANNDPRDFERAGMMALFGRR